MGPDTFETAKERSGNTSPYRRPRSAYNESWVGLSYRRVTQLVDPLRVKTNTLFIFKGTTCYPMETTWPNHQQNDKGTVSAIKFFDPQNNTRIYSISKSFILSSLKEWDERDPVLILPSELTNVEALMGEITLWRSSSFMLRNQTDDCVSVFCIDALSCLKKWKYPALGPQHLSFVHIPNVCCTPSQYGIIYFFINAS